MSLLTRQIDRKQQIPRAQRSVFSTKLNSSLLFTLLTSSSTWLILPSLAAPIVAGTPIENQATGSYVDTLNFDSAPVLSNIVALTVGEVAGITVTAGAISGTVAASNTVYFTYTITNTGNDATQFYLPGNATVTGNGVQDGNIQITGYNLNGTTPVVLAAANYVTVPLENVPSGSLIKGIATGDPAALGANGIILPGGTVTVRVPVKINSTAAVNNIITVMLGDTPIDAASTLTPKARLENQVYIDETTDQKYDLYTVDNPDGTPGEYTNPPLNGDAVNHRQEASAIVKATVVAVDYGDAPDPGVGVGTGNYQTTLADGGASHLIVTGLAIGTKVDGDSGLLQNANADADNTSVSGSNDEDGVTTFPILKAEAGKNYTVSVKVTNTTGQPAYLVGYIDFNQNGDFADTNEKSVTTITVPTGATAGSYNVTFTTPSSITAGTSYARFRLSSNKTEAEVSIGQASSGEVEDYKLSIAALFPPIANCDANNYAINVGAGAGVGGMNLLSGLSPAGYTPSIISPESSFLVNPAYSLVKAGDNNLYYAIASIAVTTSNPTYVYKYDVAANTHSQTTWQLPAVGADGYWISGATDPAGMLYFLSGKGHKLVKIDPYTDTVSTVWSTSPVTTVPGPGGIVFGTAAGTSGSYYDIGFDVNGDAFFIDNFYRHIWKVINVNSGTPTAQYLGTILGPAGVNFSDIVWLKDSGGTQRLYAISTGGIYNLDPATFATTFIPGSTTSYYDIAGCHDFGTVGGPTKAKLQLVKRITAIKDGVTAATTTFNTFNDDASTTDDNSCKWPSASSTAGVCSNTYTVGATTQTAPKVKPGDEIEYTIYYLNGGRNAATPVRVCDILNPDLKFSVQGTSGIGIAKGGAAMTMLTNASGDDKGQLTTPALATNCSLPNNSGSEVVVVDVGYTGTPLSGGLSSGFPTTSYGYIRFKAVVK
jgi:uncharacterized repeat protein (TIGR01451 family)